jgi:AcrR family transcriptional regulator
MEATRLAREDWMKTARLALLHGGGEAVRVEPLARKLKVTKGSFYWHFRDLPDLRQALIEEWEAEADLLTQALGQPEGVRQLIAVLTERVTASERGECPSDAAIFRWAAVDPAIAQRVARAEAERVALIGRLARGPEVGELFYMAYLGFILRRRHAPDAEALFSILARFALETFGAQVTPQGVETNSP